MPGPGTGSASRKGESVKLNQKKRELFSKFM